MIHQKRNRDCRTSKIINSRQSYTNGHLSYHWPFVCWRGVILVPALLLVSTKNRDLGRFITGSPRLMDFPSLCACSESSLTISLAANTKCILCACSKNWTFSEVAILGADQKERGLWGREWCGVWICVRSTEDAQKQLVRTSLKLVRILSQKENLQVFFQDSSQLKAGLKGFLRNIFVFLVMFFVVFFCFVFRARH